jgi:hypothetical protein
VHVQKINSSVLAPNFFGIVHSTEDKRTTADFLGISEYRSITYDQGRTDIVEFPVRQSLKDNFRAYARRIAGADSQYWFH